MRVAEEDRTESDHVPLEVSVNKTEQQWEQRKVEKNKDGRND